MSDKSERPYFEGPHGHSATWDPERARAIHEKAIADRKASHSAKLAERKRQREEVKAIARQEGAFIGPPNPYLYRKGRPPMRTPRA